MPDRHILIQGTPETTTNAMKLTHNRLFYSTGNGTLSFPKYWQDLTDLHRLCTFLNNELCVHEMQNYKMIGIKHLCFRLLWMDMY